MDFPGYRGGTDNTGVGNSMFEHLKVKGIVYCVEPLFLRIPPDLMGKPVSNSDNRVTFWLMLQTK